jgi:hypothetical protein
LIVDLVDQSVSASRERRRKKTTAPSNASTNAPRKSSRRSKSTLRRVSAPSQKTAISGAQNLPLVVGRTYLKVENIDLEELSVIFLIPLLIFHFLQIF